MWTLLDFSDLSLHLLSPPNDVHQEFPDWHPVSLTTGGYYLRETCVMCQLSVGRTINVRVRGS